MWCSCIGVLICKVQLCWIQCGVGLCTEKSGRKCWAKHVCNNSPPPKPPQQWKKRSRTCTIVMVCENKITWAFLCRYSWIRLKLKWEYMNLPMNVENMTFYTVFPMIIWCDGDTLSLFKWKAKIKTPFLSLTYWAEQKILLQHLTEFKDKFHLKS